MLTTLMTSPLNLTSLLSYAGDLTQPRRRRHRKRHLESALLEPYQIRRRHVHEENFAS